MPTLSVQSLEERVVPAVNVLFSSGVLTLTGSAASEAVTVRAGATYTDVLVAGRFTSRVAGATSNSLSTINFTGGGGSDSLSVSGINLGLTVGLTDVGRLSLSSPDTIVTANTGVAFGVSTVTGTLNVNAAGAITQTGRMTVIGETSLTATGGNDITLGTSGNSFGTLVLNAANVTLNETGATDLGTITTGNLTVTASGAITDSGNLSITGDTSLTSSSSTVTLDQLASSFGGSTKTVALKGTNISFRDTNATGTVLATSKATGTLDLVTAGDVTQTGGVTVTGLATIAAGAGTKQILLNSATLTNNFGSLALTGTTVSITERSATDLAGVTASSLTVTSNSAITDSDMLTVSGITSLNSTGGSITLDEIASTFGNTVTLKGRNIAIIDNDGATELGSASKATGTLAVTTTGTTGVAANDKVTQNGAISSLGRMTITAVGKDITLNTVGNKFGSIAVFGKNVDLREADASDLFTSEVSGTFALISGGGVTDSGDVSIVGTTNISTAATNKSITLDVATSDFTGAVTLSAPKNIAITNTLATNLATVTATTGTLTVISGGDVTDSGVLTVGGRATITATGRDITLNSANNYNSIAFEGRNVLLTESSATDIFTSTATGTFSLTSTGPITDSGTIEVVDNMTLSAAGQNITLDSAASTFGGNLLLTGAAVSVRDSDAIGVSLGNSTVSGLLTITSVGDITDAAATAVSAGTATFNAGTGDITLTKTTLTAATKTLRLTGQEVSVTTTTAIDLGTSTIGGDFYLKTEGVVTQSGIVTVTGATTIDADPPGVLFDITLNMVGNSFTGTIVLIGEDVLLRNNRDTYLGNTHTHGSLSIIANGNITNVLLPGPTYGVFDVDGTATFNAGTNSITLDILNSHSDFAVLPTYIAGSTNLIIPTASITLAASITSDDIVNIAESGSTIAISGTVGGHIVDYDIVTLTINGVNSTGAVASGAFSINVAGSDLAADVDRTINASVITTGYGVYNATGLDTETYQVDIVAPTVTNVFVNDVLLSDADTGTNKLVVTTDFSEAMNTAVAPTLAFGTSVTGSLTFNSGSWTDSDTYVANYNFADNNVALSSITIDVAGTQDAAFNPQQNYTELSEFSIDTLNPTVTSVTASPTTIIDATAGSGTFTVAVVFSEAMNTSATPTLTFAPTVASTLAFSSGAWTVGNTTYTATYNVSDANLDINSVTIDVTNAQDFAGNAQQDYAPLNEFDIDTVNPTVTSVSVNDTLLSDADVGTDKLVVTIDFNEAMNTGVAPTLTFGTSVTGTLTLHNGSWTDSDTYVANYNVADNNVTLTNVTIDVTGTQDANTNPQQNYAEQSEFSVDTQNPTAVSFTRKTPATTPTNADTLVFLATFSEAVTGVALADFAVTGTTATISVSQVTPSTYDVTISGGDLASLYGTVGLNLNAPTILDLNGNALPNTEPATDETYFIDNTTLDVTVSGNDLVIEDVDASGKDNQLSLSRSGSNLVITDVNEQLDSSIVGAVFSNGRKTITVPVSALGVGGKIIFKTQGGSDSLSVDVATDLGFDVDYLGGSGTSDSLTLVADNVTSVTYAFTNANDGSITIVDGSTRVITFTGLEPITDNLNAADRSFTFNGGGESISLIDASGAAMTIDSDLAESVTFANPTSSLTVSAGSGNDTVTITSVDVSFNAALTINGDGSTDTVNLNSDITFASGRSLNVTAESVSVGASADLTTSGAGVITFTADDVSLNATSTLTSAGTVTFLTQTAARAIDLGSETSGQLSLTDTELDRVTAGTVNIGDTNSGTMTVSAAISHGNNLSLTTGAGIAVNQAVTMASNKGLTASAVGTISLGANLQTDGGSVTLTGNTSLATSSVTIDTESGDDSNAGSVTFSGGSISAGAANRDLSINTTTGGTNTSGNISLSTVDSNAGSAVRHLTLNASQTVTPSAAGDVTLAGAITLASNGNLDIDARTVTLSTSSSDVAVSGTGTVSIDTSRNVSLVSGSSLSVVNGNLTINANQQVTATTGSFVGIELVGTLTSSGTGEINLNGRSGTTSATVIDDDGVAITGLVQSTANGAITIVGVSNTAGSDGNGEGVTVAGTGTVQSLDGNIAITGTGGAGSGTANVGVLLYDGTVKSTGTGNVQITGTAGGGASQGISLGQPTDRITTNSGSIAITATGNSTVDLETVASSQINSTSGPITLTVNRLNLQGTLSTSGNVNLLTRTAGTAINLGSTTDNSSTTLEISDAELDRVTTTGTLHIGNSSSGAITVSAAISRASGGGVLSLESGAAVTSSAGGSIAVTGNDLAVRAGGAITLDQGNSVLDFAATTSSGGVTYVESTSGGAVNIDDVDGVGGVSTAGGAINISTTDGSITVSNTASTNDVDADTGTVTLTAGQTAGTLRTLTMNNSTVVRGTGGVTFIANDMSIGTTGTGVNGGSNTVTLRNEDAGVAIDLGTNTASQLGLTDAELDRVTAGTLSIGDTSSGTITFSAAITRSASTIVSVTTGSGNNIAFSGSGSVDSAGGNVTLTTSGSGAITSGSATTDSIAGAGTISLNAGSGGIGANGNPVVVSGTNLNSTTSDNGNQFLSVTGSITVDATGLSAGTGTVELDGGTFTLGGSDRINNSTKLDVNGATFAIAGFNETVDTLTLTSGSITGSGGVLTSTNTIQTKSGSVSAVLSGTNGLTQTTSGTTILSGANTYTGTTTISAGTLQIGSGGTTGSLSTSSGITNNGTLAFNRSNTITQGTDFNSVISGTGSVTQSGSGTLVFNGTNTYSGSTTIAAGFLNANSSAALGDESATNTLIFAGGRLQAGASFTSPSTRTVTLTSTGIFATNGFNVTIAGAISGVGFNVQKNNTGDLTLSGANTYTGTTTIGTGTLYVNGSLTSDVTVTAAATLGGTGTISSGNTVTVQSTGTVAPGTSPGILNTGNVTFVSGSIFSVEIGGTTAGNTSGNHDQLNVTGTVDLGGATLSTAAFSGFVPASGNTYVIILNDGADAITGTFNGLVQGATISTNFLGSGLTATISYVGGSGNDVVIIVS